MANAVALKTVKKSFTEDGEKSRIRANIRKYRALYLMALPGILYFVVFRYIPLAGNIIAFQDYNIFKGFLGSPFVGLKNFIMMINYYDFQRILKNTMLIALYDIIFYFPAPLILALIINEITGIRFKRFVQQTIYLPHFLSWTILGGIVTMQLLSPSQGLFNDLLKYFGREPVYFMIRPELARSIVVSAGMWKEIGWGTIIYLAALSAINPSLYESASIDGAGRVRQLFAITLPAILPIIVTLFLLRIGNFLECGFDRIQVLRNASNQVNIDIFDTYMYNFGLLQGRFSYATAIGIFKSIVGLVLLLISNKLSKKWTGEGLF